MRGEESQQTGLFSYVSLESRIPKTHPLRKIRALVDAILGSMDSTFAGLYSDQARASIPPERLLRASLLQVLYSKTRLVASFQPKLADIRGVQSDADELAVGLGAKGECGMTWGQSVQNMRLDHQIAKSVVWARYLTRKAPISAVFRLVNERFSPCC